MTRLKKEMELCQLQRYEIGFVLSLRSHFFYGKAIEQHLQLIAMNTRGCVANSDITLSVILKHVPEVSIVELRDIIERDLLTRLTDACIKLIEDGCKRINNSVSYLMNEDTIINHLILA